MKKILLTTVCVLFVIFTSDAQRFSYGFKAGANWSSMNVKGDDTKVGFNGGVFGQIRVLNFAIQPELLLSMQGAKYDYKRQIDDMLFPDYSGKVNANYLSVPIMVQHYIISRLNIEVGPQISFLLSAKDKPDDWQSYKVKSYMKKTDFALNFGTSYQLPLLPIGVYARYSLGLTDIFEDKDNPVFEGKKGKNRVGQIGMFVRF